MKTRILFKPNAWILLLFTFSLLQLNAQAPAHLKYFGYVAIDCLYDDPLDVSTLTNYISEVDTFSNIAHMCVYDYTDNIIARTNDMNAHCVNPMLQVQSVFFEEVDTLAPSGTNYDLYSDFTSRWNTFMTINASVFVPSKISCFYIIDEPFWNGVSLAEMDTVCTLLKNAFPTIPILMVEAYTTVNVMQVPVAMDWVGFDRYGVFDPEFDVDFQNDLDTVKSRLSSPNQKIILVIDDQWLPFYGDAGFSPDTMKYVVQNYYDLAVADTSVIGLIGYIWPGGLDDPGHLGVRNLTQGVIDKNVEIGQLIKANFSPCSVQYVTENEAINEQILLYPNPVSDQLTLEFNSEQTIAGITIYNLVGEIEQFLPKITTKSLSIATSDLPNGFYLLTVELGDRRISERFSINR